MAKYGTVAILGVGLIGGSIGLALRRRGLAEHVVGIGRRRTSLNRARKFSTVDSTTLDLARGVKNAEIIVVCTPVARIAEHVRQVAASCPAGAIITDAGSIKGEILAALKQDMATGFGRGVHFVGSHPLAGGEKTGPEFARADLFEDRVTIVTPTGSGGTGVLAERGGTGVSPVQAAETTDPDARTIAFWQSLGSRVVTMSAEQHDAAVAAVSHAPHAAASAIAAATPRDLLELVGGGWLDTTRIAAGDVELWRQILTGNRRYVVKALAAVEQTLGRLRRALQQKDDEQLVTLLQAGKDRRDAVGS